MAATTYGETMEAFLAQYIPDVLTLDVFVPTSAENLTYYPVLQAIPRWLQLYPRLSILVITAHNLRTLVNAVIRAGASGYVLKDDQATIQELASVVRSIAQGGICFSEKVHHHILYQESEGSLLSTRQLQALSLWAAHPEATIDELAGMLRTSRTTLRTLLYEAYLRLGATNRIDAIQRAKQLGLISTQESLADSS